MICKSRSQRTIRWFVRLLAAAIALEAIYVIAANLLLHERLAALAGEARLKVHTGKILTLYPGSLRTGRLKLVSRNPALSIEAKAVSGSLKILPLLLGSVRVSRLRAQGVHIETRRLPDWLAFASHEDRQPDQHSSAPRRNDVAPMSIMSLRRTVRFDRVDAEVAKIEVGRLRWRGEMEVTIASLTLPTPVDTFDVSMRWRDANVGMEALSLVDEFQGDLTFQVLAPRDSHQQQSRWMARTVGRMTLSAYTGHIASPSSASRVSADDVRLDATLAMDRGRLSAGTSLTARAGRVAMLLAPPETQSQQHRARVHHLKVHAEVLRNTNAENAPPVGLLSMECEQAEMPRPGFGQSVAISAQTKFEQLHERLELAFTEGQLRARTLNADGNSSSAAEQFLHFEWANAFWSPSCMAMKGALEVHGRDAAVLLDVLGVDPGVRWMLAELEARPFMLKLDLRLQPSRAAFENITLETSVARGKGAIYLDGRFPLGAVLLERGKLEIGVTLSGQETLVRMAPDRAWLASTLQDLSSRVPVSAECTP